MAERQEKGGEDRPGWASASRPRKKGKWPCEPREKERAGSKERGDGRPAAGLFGPKVKKGVRDENKSFSFSVSIFQTIFKLNFEFLSSFDRNQSTQ
jgi:hypothetical protein